MSPELAWATFGLTGVAVLGAQGDVPGAVSLLSAVLSGWWALRVYRAP